MGYYIKALIICIFFLHTAVYAQNNLDQLYKNIEFTYDFYQWLEGYTDKVDKVSNQAEQFRQLLDDVVNSKPSDIMATDVAKPVGELLRDFKKEAQSIKVPDYQNFVPSAVVLTDDVYGNRKMITDEVERVSHLHRYFQRLKDIKSLLVDLDTRYQQMKEGIRDVQEMFRQHGKLLVGLEYDWIAFETTYPNILSEAHTIIRDKRKAYIELESKTQGDLLIAAQIVLRNLEDEKVKNQSAKEEYEKLKKLNEDVKASRKVLDDLKKQISRNDSLVVLADKRIEEDKASVKFYSDRLKGDKERRNKMREPGYIERTYSSCPSGKPWDQCTNASHLPYKNEHRNNINNEISRLTNSLTSYSNLITQKEQAIVQEQNNKNQLMQQTARASNEYRQKTPPHLIKENELKSKSLQFLESFINNIIESFFRSNQSETMKIKGILTALN